LPQKKFPKWELFRIFVEEIIRETAPSTTASAPQPGQVAVLAEQ
jgi:hypothetical protein